MSYPTPSLKELRNQLERAETGLYRADMIDSPNHRAREMQRFRNQIDRIKTQIAEIEGSDHG